MTDPALREQCRERHRAHEARRASTRSSCTAAVRRSRRTWSGSDMPVEFFDGPARHRRRGHGGREDGARRQGEQGARLRDQRPRSSRRGHRRRRRQPHPARRSSTRGSAAWARSTAIDTTVVTNLIDDGFIPVIASVGSGDDGGSLQHQRRPRGGRARRGARRREGHLPDRRGRSLRGLRRQGLAHQRAHARARRRRCIADDELAERHDPEGRARACARSAAVCERAHILNGTIPHALLLEVYTDEGVGTMITARRQPRPADDSTYTAYEGEVTL